ncbi:MAG: hypothetical protein BWY09_00131 [Candidatus Hydrogenedentes bacterium ADurb.Bin179]|nr:MAG: hypothetical protein BWY09_00131 [Candidatus Hydrogenedentes bacterium ADurb.Bin179]
MPVITPQGFRNIFLGRQHRFHRAIEQAGKIIQRVDVGRIRRGHHQRRTPLLHGNHAVQGGNRAVHQRAHARRYLPFRQVDKGNTQLFGKQFRNLRLAQIAQPHQDITQFAVAHGSALTFQRLIQLFLRN